MEMISTRSRTMIQALLDVNTLSSMYRASLNINYLMDRAQPPTDPSRDHREDHQAMMTLLRYFTNHRYNLIDIGIFSAVSQALINQHWFIAALIFFPGILASTLLTMAARP